MNTEELQPTTPAVRREPPPCLPGFEAIRRYWDKPNGAFTAKLLPGEFYVTIGDEILSTVLGAGVAVCVRDPQRGVAGMTHFLLPQDEGVIVGVAGQAPETRLRFGDRSLSRLIETVLANGGQTDRLEFKVFGGGRAFAETEAAARRSIAFVQGWLRDRQHVAVAEDLGGPFSRKLLFFPASGKVRVKKLRDLQNDTLLKRDRDYLLGLGVMKGRG